MRPCVNAVLRLIRALVDVDIVVLTLLLQLCTLSAAGGELLKQCPLFDVLVVDEAAQALEPATLIPLGLIKPSERR
jgi:superfamily I DNA and/or RNA helicase